MMIRSQCVPYSIDLTRTIGLRTFHVLRLLRAQVWCRAFQCQELRVQDLGSRVWGLGRRVFRISSLLSQHRAKAPREAWQRQKCESRPCGGPGFRGLGLRV